MDFLEQVESIQSNLYSIDYHPFPFDMNGRVSFKDHINQLNLSDEIIDNYKIITNLYINNRSESNLDNIVVFEYPFKSKTLEEANINTEEYIKEIKNLSNHQQCASDNKEMIITIYNFNNATFLTVDVMTEDIDRYFLVCNRLNLFV